MITRPRSQIAEIHEFNHELVQLLRRLGAVVGVIKESKPLCAQPVIKNVTWSSYRAFLQAIVRKGLRHTYRHGTLELMALRTYWRESRKSVVRRFAQHVSSELAVNLTSLGRVPIGSPLQEIGLEPDEAFAVEANGCRRVKPNLVIEVADGGTEPRDLAVEEYAISRMTVLRELGIIEVWLVHEESVAIFVNQQKSWWKKMHASQLIPAVSASLLSKHLARSRRVGENDAIRGLLYDVSQENAEVR